MWQINLRNKRQAAVDAQAQVAIWEGKLAEDSKEESAFPEMDQGGVNIDRDCLARAQEKLTEAQQDLANAERGPVRL
jgi:hypothetical protein